MFLSAALLVPGLVVSVGAALVKRDPSTTATCSPEFSWANNEQGESPCLVAAYVDGACVDKNFQVPALSSINSPTGAHYSVQPGDANDCTCSWASYNLLSACTACQNQTSSILTWEAIRENCTGNLLNTYFPPDTIIANGTTIPFWATTNPQNWTDGTFDVGAAENIATQDRADVIAPSPSPSSTPSGKSKPPIGAIVGGVIGGVVVLILGIVTFLCIRSRNPRRVGQNQSGPQRPAHWRSISDFSQKSGTSYGQQQFAPSLEPIPASPVTMQSHSGSVTTFSHYGSAQGSIFSFPMNPISAVRRVLSPPPQQQNFQVGLGPVPPTPPPPPPQSPPHERIDPFDMQQGSSNGGRSPSSPGLPPGHHRKLTSESSENNLPVSRAPEEGVPGPADEDIGRTPSITSSRRAPMNPPAYSANDVAAIRREARGHAHAQRGNSTYSQASVGSTQVSPQASWDSNAGGSIMGPPGAGLSRNIAYSLAGGVDRSGAGTPAMQQVDEEVEIA